MIKLKSSYFFISFFLHVLVVASFIVFSHEEIYQKNFIVLGVHSQKTTKAFYKPLRYTVPFTSSSSGIKSQGSKKRTTVTQKKAGVRASKIRRASQQKKVLEQKTTKPEKITTVEKEKVKKPKKKKRERALSKKQKKKLLKEVKQKPKKQELVQQKKLVKQEQALAAVLKQKKLAPKLLEESEKPEKLDVQDASFTSTVEQKVEMIAENDTDEDLQFTLGELSDVRLREYHECIQKEVSRLWHPPVGVPKGTECTMFFHLDREGKVKNFEIMQRSKVLIYDLSVLRIAQQIALNHPGLQGKKFTIVFRQ